MYRAFVSEDKYDAGDFNLINGDILDSQNFAAARTASVLFVNNAESVFGMRSVAEGKLSLDHHVARLACGLRNGSRVLCFESLLELDAYPISSCFTRDQKTSEPGATSWTFKSKNASEFWIYTKVSDYWTCETCKHRNLLVRPSPKSSYGEVIQDSCVFCNSDPAGARKRYSLRSKR